MKDSPRSDHGTLPLVVAQALDRLSDRFDKAWQAAAAGDRPRLEDYVAEIAAEHRPYLLRELIPLDVEYRRGRGEQPQVDDYLARFPELDRSWLTRVVAAAVGQQPAESVSAPAEGTRTQRLRCPQCQSPIQLADGQGEVVLCPGCGSSFHVRDARQTTTNQGMRQIGKFQLLERVGLGAFGAVWKARDTELDRIVALKIPHTGLLTSDVELERFHREARAAAQLRHPGIVTVHEVQTLEGLPTIVADFIHGVTLKDLLEARRLTFREAATLIAEAAEALDYAHQLGLVHRDLKPANIMVETPRLRFEENGLADDEAKPEPDRVGQPLVMDFGLALRDEAEITMTTDGLVLGTPAYMSPEQAAGYSHRADRRSDVYSLGVILYQLLTGELPFRGSKAMLLHQVQHEEPRPPRTINDKIPRDLETICLKAMAKAPGRRYGRAGELAEDLRRYLRGEPVQARPVGRLERLGRWCQRNPGVAGLAVAVVLALVSGTAISTFFAFQAQEQAGQAREQAQQAQANAIQMQAARDRADRESRLARANEFKVRQHAYAAQINLAQRAWEDGQIRRVEELLEAQKPEHTGGHDFRGFEWHLLKRLSHAEILSLTDPAHRRWMNVVFSPDGTRLVAFPDAWTTERSTGQEKDKSLTVWETATGRLLFSSKELSGPILSVCFSSDSQLLQGVDESGQLTTWDVGTGKTVKSLPGFGRKVLAAAFSGDGHFVALATGPDSERPDRLQVWDTTTGEQKRDLPIDHSIKRLSLSPDGRQLAVGSFVGVPGATLGGAFLALEWALGKSPGIQTWDVTTGKQLYTCDQEGGILHLAFSPDGKSLASGGRDKTVRVWDTATGREVRRFSGYGSMAASVCFSADSRQIATGGRDGMVRVWDAKTGEEAYTFRGHVDEVTGVAFSPDGKRLASASDDGTVKVWDVTHDPQAIIYREPTVPLSMQLAFHPDLQHVALVRSTLGTQVRVWNFVTREMTEALERNFLADIMLPPAGAEGSIAFSPDGKWLALGGVNYFALATERKHEGEVKVWDVERRKFILTLKGNSLVRRLIFSPDSQRLACGGIEWFTTEGAVPGEGCVWDLATGQMVRTVRASDVFFGPDGHCLAVRREEKMLIIRDEDAGREILKVPGFYGMLSPDGRRLAAAGLYGPMSVWNICTGEEIATFAGPRSNAAFSPDGRRLATIDEKFNVQVWDADTGDELLRFKESKCNLMHLAFSPDGYRLGVVGTEGRSCFVKIWDGMPREEKPAGR